MLFSIKACSIKCNGKHNYNLIIYCLFLFEYECKQSTAHLGLESRGHLPPPFLMTQLGLGIQLQSSRNAQFGFCLSFYGSLGRKFVWIDTYVLGFFLLSNFLTIYLSIYLSTLLSIYYLYTSYKISVPWILLPIQLQLQQGYSSKSTETFKKTSSSVASSFF